MRPPGTFLRWTLTFVLIGLLHTWGVRPSPATAETRVLLLLDPIGVAEIHGLTDQVRLAGGRVDHVVPGRALIGWFEPDRLSYLSSLSGVRSVFPAGTVPEIPADADPVLKGVVFAWEQMTGFRPSAADERTHGLPLAGDAALPPRSDDAGGESLAPPPGGGFFDTSEFMPGSLTVVVLLPESDGTIDPNQEDWTAAEETNVTAEIMNGMAWWTDRAAEIGSSFTFFYDFRFSIDQGYEPINRPSSNHNLWVAATMTALGYTAFGSQFDNVRDLLNDERDAFGTDWAVSMFVIDDTIDPDNNFTSGFYAFSFYGGPYLWMTYDEDGWGNENMDMISAHELGHSFYALDEYASSGCGCNESQGYLNGKNQNCDAACNSNIPDCIMRSGTIPISANVLEFNTAKQVGLLDADGDSITNILDTAPETTLDPYGSDSTADFTPTYTGTAVVVPKENLNPFGPGNDITLNRIALVEFRVDGGSWTAATPIDGSFDGASEAFTFTTSALANGAHVVEARAVHSYGNADLLPAMDTLAVIGSPVSVTSAGPGSPETVAASPTVSRGAFTIRFGVTSPARVRIAIYSLEGRLVATLADKVFGPTRHEVRWDGRLANGDPASAGVYLVSLEAPNRSERTRIVIVR